MAACTFFGHHDAPNSVEPFLRTAVQNLIRHKSVRLFYVGCQGSYDAMVRRLLEELSVTEKIKYYIVQAYLPKNDEMFCANTLYPEGLECVPRRFAISKRNLWMIEHSQYVIVYTRDCTGNTEKMKQSAIRKGKTVISI